MAEPVEYVVWFHKVFGTTLKAHRAFTYYGSCENLYNAVMSGQDLSGLTADMPPSKYKSFSILDAQKIIALCEDNGWNIIPYYSQFYPSELNEIGNYPMMLFAHGKKEILARPVKIALVGSREAEKKGEIAAYNASFNMSKAGAVIVSGAALGIDSCAHLGAIESGGETIGVLGCGLGSSYMNRIGEFYDKVLTHGVYITEMFPYMNASRYTFPERNRLISGISRAVLVAYAGESSGSLGTAECAKKQNRRVYALAPEICASVGCNKLLSGGAYYFYNAGDIVYPLREYFPKESLNEYYCNRPVSASVGVINYEELAVPHKKAARAPSEKAAEKKNKPAVQEERPSPPVKEKELPDNLSDNAKKIYSLLGDTPMQRDSLVNLAGLRIPQVLCAVTELETQGLIKTVPGGRIEKIN